MTRLHFQPIQGKTFAIIDAILRTEEVASGGKMPDGIHLVVEEVVVNIAEHACLDDTNGSLDVEIERQDERIMLCFICSGSCWYWCCRYAGACFRYRLCGGGCCGPSVWRCS